MTGSRSELDESSNSEVDGVIAAMLISLEQGTPLKLEDWVARYPDLEEKLRDFFQDHVRMEAALADPGQSASALHAGESAEPPDSFADMENQSFGDYLLVKEIDRGGMGVIFEALDQKLNRRVAIKMIKSGGLASATEVARFHAEANSAASLDHAHIVPVYDSGQIQGLHFFSMALIEGETLSAKIMKGPLDVQEAVMVAKKIASAIAYAHREGVIHRDLKPGNILIDQNNEPRITDFGLAHNPNMNQQLTTDGQILGTPAYMPPEQARGQSVAANPAADVYSIGAILFHCLTAQAPHTADNPLDVLLRVQEVAPLPPHKLNPKVSKPLSDIVLRCLEKKPANRYETATQLERDLDRFLRGETPEAGQVGRIQKIRRTCRRHPLLTAHLGGISTIFAVSTLFFLSHQDLGYYLGHSMIMVLWAALCFPLARGIRNTVWRDQIEAIWGSVDVVAFTLLLHGVDGPAKTTYLIGYPFIIASSGFFGRRRLVLAITAQCITAYLLLCFLHTEDLIPIGDPERPNLNRRIHQPLFYCCGLFLIGMVIRAQVKRLRSMSQYFEVNR